MNFKVPIAFVMGDMKGNDLLAGKFGSHSTLVQKISRACNCDAQHADRPMKSCEYHTQAFIASIKDQENKADAYKSISYHEVNNAFYKVSFGGDIYGIHGCTPVDIVLHTLQQGLFKYIPKCLYKLLEPTNSSTIDEIV